MREGEDEKCQLSFFIPHPSFSGSPLSRKEMNLKPVLRYCYLSLTLLVLMLALAVEGAAQTTEVTYQGKLTDAGMPASGNYDLQFKLFDTPTVGTGTQQGSTLTLTSIAVAAGIFTVQLDFGAGVFSGATRYLEISVKPSSGSTFTTLGPRQVLTSAPYTIRSLNATSADGLSLACMNCVTSSQIQSVQGAQVTGNIAGNQISGAIPVASVPAGSASYIQNSTSQQAASNFNISGNGTASGTLSGNLVNAFTQYNIGGSRVFAADVTGGGANNTFVGGFAGTNNNTGVHNSFFGFGAGFNNNAGGDNSFFGAQAGGSNNGFSNSFFGSFAGVANTTGSENAFFGRAAGQANTTGNNNAFFGRSAGTTNSTGTSNAFFGRSAGQSNITGSNNAFFGDLAGNTNNASFNSFFGSNAGFSNTSGASNSFVGFQAGSLNSTGSLNTFFGYIAGSNSTTQHDNTFMGYEAGLNNGMGDTTNVANYNTFLGSVAGQNNTTGQRNSFVGYQAGVDNTTGSFNAFFGVNAGTLHKTGIFNTFIGFNTGYISVNPTGNNNTLLGYGGTVTSGVNNGTALGALAQVDISNSLVLGSINGVNGANADTNVGIGTTAPSARLQIVTTNDTNPGFVQTWDSRHIVIGGLATIGGIAMSYDQTNSVGYLEALTPNVAWRNLSIQAGGGRVGIGTSLPDQTLTVNGGASKPGGGSWSTFSDARLKTVTGRFTTGLKALLEVQPVRYEYAAGNALGIAARGEHIGLVAQDLQSAIPEAVTRNEQGYLLVNNDPVLWAMVNAIKEQQIEIAQLQKQILRLRTRLTRRGNKRLHR
jgi:hypothetical protein